MGPLSRLEKGSEDSTSTPRSGEETSVICKQDRVKVTFIVKNTVIKVMVGVMVNGHKLQLSVVIGIAKVKVILYS